MKQASPLVKNAETFIKTAFLKKLPQEFLYHNYDHCREVARVCYDYAISNNLPADLTEQLLLAAWFHDIGYIRGAAGHEEESARIARAFLQDRNYDEKGIQRVESLILSTAKDAADGSELEKVLHDASWSFLGKKSFFKRARLLLLEKEYTEGKRYTLFELNEKMLDLQLSYRYYTAWAREKFHSRKVKNISLQKENLVRADEKTVRQRSGKNFGRGVDTVYRITLRNHITLSSIADGKASILISINTLVISIIITLSAAGFSLNQISFIEDSPKSALAVVVLMLSSLAAIILAVFSTIPKVSSTSFGIEDVEGHKVSLLYFGNFLKLQKEQFVDYLRELKKDQEILYDDLSRDLYNLGLVLQKKYRLLSLSYYIFVSGLAISVILFLFVYFIL